MRAAANQFVDIERGADGGTAVAAPRTLSGRSCEWHGRDWRRSTSPTSGCRSVRPEIPAALYAARVERLRERAETRGYDRLVVYADREHSANLAYLTGFDPRFEEAVLVLGPSGDPAILVGNECHGMAGAAPLPMRPVLFQDLSLPSQPRDRSRPLAEILGDEGIRAGSRVGVVGWKTYAGRAMIDAPAFLVDELRRITGPSGAVENADRPADRRRRRPAGDQRGRAARRLRVRRLPDLAGRAPAPVRPATGDDRARGRPPARLERHARSPAT